MQRRGLVAALLVCVTFGGWAGVAVAATAPAPTPPPLCFVVKDGALPTCTESSDGTWTAVYPKGGGNLKDDDSGGGSTKKDLELAVAIAAILGIGVIVWWNWIRPRSRAAAPASLPVVSPPTVTNPPANPGAPGGYFASPPDEPPPA